MAEENKVRVLPQVDNNPDADRIANMRVAGQSLRLPDHTVTRSAAEQVFGLFRDHAPLGYMLPFQALDYIEILARYNPDYSQAVDNIKTLANSGHDLFIDAKSTNKAEKLKARIQEKARTIQQTHGGIDGLVSKLLDQGATYGAIAGEWVANEDLTDIIDFVDVNPKTIRFFWEPNGNPWNPYPHWAPYQKVSAAQAKEAEKNGQKVINNHVQLNEITFVYYAFDAAPGSPYGTPPFLAALQPISIQKDMIDNLSKIVKKVGLLSIIDVAIEPLGKMPGEDDGAFVNRAKQYLEEYATGIQSMVEDGGLAHFTDSTITNTSISGNAAGASAIFKQNEELVFSGLKSMPSVQGRSYSTTETYAGVAYDIIIRNTFKYQRAIKRLIERGYWLMATMWGENPEGIRLEFHSNKSLHRLQDAQSELLEIKIALMLWASGVLDQLGFAQELGYSSVKTEYEDIPENPILGNSSPGGGAGATSTDDQVVEPTSSDGQKEANNRYLATVMARLEEVQDTLHSIQA